MMIDRTPTRPHSADRWGPSLDHERPGIEVPSDHWRWRVANWPSDAWKTWRDLATSYLPPKATAAQIRETDEMAYRELERAALNVAAYSAPESSTALVPGTFAIRVADAAPRLHVAAPCPYCGRTHESPWQGDLPPLHARHDADANVVPGSVRVGHAPRLMRAECEADREDGRSLWIVPDPDANDFNASVLSELAEMRQMARGLPPW